MYLPEIIFVWHIQLIKSLNIYVKIVESKPQMGQWIHSSWEMWESGNLNVVNEAAYIVY